MSIFYKFLQVIPLKLRLRLFYFLKFKKHLRLTNPILYSEKLQKRKLNLLPIYSTLSDKLLVKEYISSQIGPKYVIPTLFHTDNPENINFETLPEKFVIKTNFGSGSEHISIIKNNSEINKDLLVRKFNSAMNKKYKGSILGEKQYDLINKKIIIEKFIDNGEKDIDDFKFHIFNSNDGFLQVDFDRFKNHKRNLYDLKFNRLNYDLCYSGGDYQLPSANQLDEMKKIAFKLSQGFDYVRIDLYLVNGQVLFGEMTFTPGNGFELFSDPQADKFYGQLWKQDF